MNVKHILLVEDDPRDEELTLAALEEHNLANQVFVVHDGEEALDYLYYRGKFKTRSTGNPVAVLLDLKMPKVDGLEVLRIIKADERLKLIPIVILTSSRETPDLIECYEHGVNAYVVKPVDFTAFVNAVKHLGVFWAVVNEPPPSYAGRGEIALQKEEFVFSGKKEVRHEIPALRPAFGG
jgi:CheY-like chemotaxis protein